jgi:hypothetical protein
MTYLDVDEYREIPATLLLTRHCETSSTNPARKLIVPVAGLDSYSLSRFFSLFRLDEYSQEVNDRAWQLEMANLRWMTVNMLHPKYGQFVTKEKSLVVSWPQKLHRGNHLQNFFHTISSSS